MTNFLDDVWASGDLDFKAISGQLNVDEAQGIVECFVAAVGNKDSVGDIVAPGAFDGSLRRRKPRVVWGHDWNQPIGKVLAIDEVAPTDQRLPQKMKAAGVGGLLARVQFNLKSERGREAFHSVAFFGEDQEWSIGYKTIQATYDAQMQANVLQEVELFEVSPVLHGANQLTGTISIKTAENESADDFEIEAKMDIADIVPERRVLISIKGMYAEIADGPNVRKIHTEDLLQEGSAVYGEERPGLGNAISDEVDATIMLRVADENFVIFDRHNNNGTETTYFMPYHFDGGRYMFGKPMPVEVELDLEFDLDQEDEDDENEYLKDYYVEERDSEMKAIGTAIGASGGQSSDPNDTVDRNRNGRIFDGTPNEQAARRRSTDSQNSGAGPAGPSRNSRRGIQGPAGPTGPARTPKRRGMGRAAGPQNQQVENVRALNNIRDRRGPGGTENRAGIARAGAYLRAAEANDRANTPKPAGPQNQQLENVRRLVNIRDQRGPGGTENRSRIAQAGAYLRAAEANDRANTPKPMGPKNQQVENVRALNNIRDRRGPGGTENRAGIARAGRYLNAARDNESSVGAVGPKGPAGKPGQVSDNVQRLLDIQQRGNRREIRQAGRYLRAAAANDRANAGKPAGPARTQGPTGPQKRERWQNYDVTGTGFTGPMGTQGPQGKPRTRKDAYDPSLTWTEVLEIEIKELYNPALSADEWTNLNEKDMF